MTDPLAGLVRVVGRRGDRRRGTDRLDLIGVPGRIDEGRHHYGRRSRLRPREQHRGRPENPVRAREFTVLPLQPSSRALAPRSSSPAAGRHHAWRGAPSGGASPPSSRSARPRTESHPTASHDCLGGRTRAGRLALEPQVHTCMVVPWARPRIWNLRKTPGRFNLDSGVELADDARKNAVYCHNIAPDFAGWDTNPDWAFNLVFGYLNRNCEDISIFPSGRTACSSPKDFGEQPVRVDVDRPRENRERLGSSW